MSWPEAGPKLSVIVPVYNSLPYLEECVASLAAQVYRCFEVIFIDDGSEDGSADLLDAWQDRDARFKVIHQANGGVSAARNVGMSIATGSILVFVDADDWLGPDALATVADAFAVSGADVVVFGAQCEPEEAAPPRVRRLLAPREATYRGGSADLAFAANAVPYVFRTAARRDLVERENIRFIEGLALAEDLAFQLELYAVAGSVFLSSERPYHYRMVGSSATHRFNSHAQRVEKLDQHLAALRHVLSFWSNKGLLSAYRQSFVPWCFDFLMFDVSSLPARAQCSYVSQVDAMLVSAFGDTYDSCLTGPSRAVAQRVRRGAPFDSLASRLLLVRFFVSSRGLRECFERVKRVIVRR